MCAEYGIPHSRFLAWPASDRDKAIWMHLRHRQECPGCGTRPDEWDPSRGGRLDAYTAAPVRCRGCAKKNELTQKNDDPALYTVLKPTP